MVRTRLGRDLSEVIPRPPDGLVPTYTFYIIMSRRARVHTTYSVKTEPILQVAALEAAKHERL